MASDLLATQRLEGKSREDILDMLGEPDSRRSKVEFYAYPLDDFYLRIRFNENDLVESAHLVSD